MNGALIPNEDELILLLKAGNRDAYTEIYHRYKFILHSHAYKMLGDREEAKDVIQEIFTQLWVQREIITVNVNLSGYLYQATRNRILNLIAHKQVQSKYMLSLEKYIDVGDYITDNAIRERELTLIIEKEINALPPKMREVFELSRMVNLTHREISQQLEISEQTVRTHVKHALRILRVKLGLFIYLIYLFQYWR